jgi:hypothetical protein
VNVKIDIDFLELRHHALLRLPPVNLSKLPQGVKRSFLEI